MNHKMHICAPVLWVLLESVVLTFIVENEETEPGMIYKGNNYGQGTRDSGKVLQTNFGK